MLIKLIEEKILPVIFKYIPKEECAVFLFGSFAQDAAARSSDLDIGIVCDKPLANLTLIKIKEELEGGILRDIDLIDFTSASDKEFLKIALRRIKICHQTPRSRAYLASLYKRAKG